jgi:regulatory protein
MSGESRYSFLEVKAKLEALCAYQERCSFELEQKMIRWGIPQDDRDALLAHLISHNFLSEERFAEAFVSGKFRIKKWGRIKIKNGLKQKRISDYSISKGLASIDDDEYWNQLISLAEKKLTLISSAKNDYPTRVKLYRFLNGRGFEQSLVKEAVEEAFNQREF